MTLKSFKHWSKDNYIDANNFFTEKCDEERIPSFFLDHMYAKKVRWGYIFNFVTYLNLWAIACFNQSSQ